MLISYPFNFIGDDGHYYISDTAIAQEDESIGC